MKEYSFRIRATCLASKEALGKVLKDKCIEYTVGYEVPEDNPDNPHYQGYLKSSYADITLRKAFVEILTVRGNKAYSLSALRKTKEELLQYVCKDCNVQFTTLSEEEIQVYQAIGSSRKEEIKKVRDKKKKTPTAIEKMMLDPKIMDSNSKVELCKNVILWYVEHNRMIPGDLQLRQIVVTIRLRQYMNAEPSQCEKIADAMARRMFVTDYFEQGKAQRDELELFS